VEDRIIGNLGFSQMMLLILPVFIGAGLFAMLPPLMNPSTMKYVTMGVIAILCSLLAVRIKEKILVQWMVQILRYMLRPRMYVFNKNVLSGREMYATSIQQRHPELPLLPPTLPQKRYQLDISERVKVYSALEDPRHHLRFETNKKGVVYVRLSETKKETV
jgi:hypothetical protein